MICQYLGKPVFKVVETVGCEYENKWLLHDIDRRLLESIASSYQTSPRDTTFAKLIAKNAVERLV